MFEKLILTPYALGGHDDFWFLKDVGTLVEPKVWVFDFLEEGGNPGDLDGESSWEAMAEWMARNGISSGFFSGGPLGCIYLAQG